MKKYIALMLTILFALSLASSAMAAYDFSFVAEYDGLYEVSLHEDEDYAFIDCISNSSVADYSFATPYESEQYYSYLYNDLIVLDYSTDEAYSVWRLWVEYTGTQTIKANKIAFTFDGKTFTFGNLYDEENMDREENGDYAETYMIKFGPDSLPFIEALSTYVDTLSTGDSPYDSLMSNGAITMTMYGADEKITVTLPNLFLMDFDVMLRAFSAGDGNLNDATDPTLVLAD